MDFQKFLLENRDKIEKIAIENGKYNFDDDLAVFEETGKK